MIPEQVVWVYIDMGLFALSPLFEWFDYILDPDLWVE